MAPVAVAVDQHAVGVLVGRPLLRLDPDRGAGRAQADPQARDVRALEPGHHLARALEQRPARSLVGGGVPLAALAGSLDRHHVAEGQDAERARGVPPPGVDAGVRREDDLRAHGLDPGIAGQGAGGDAGGIHDHAPGREGRQREPGEGAARRRPDGPGARGGSGAGRPAGAASASRPGSRRRERSRPRPGRRRRPPPSAAPAPLPARPAGARPRSGPRRSRRRPRAARRAWRGPRPPRARPPHPGPAGSQRAGPAADAVSSGRSRARTSTSTPASASRTPHVRPITPAPTTVTCGGMGRSCRVRGTAATRAGRPAGRTGSRRPRCRWVRRWRSRRSGC